MSKSKPLYGTSKDAYFRRVLRAEPGVGAAAMERILRRLQTEVVQVRLREAAQAPGVERAVAEAEAASAAGEAITASGGQLPGELHEVPPGFDPFTPNVVVLIRTAGRERALAALSHIDRVEHLRLLAREQQLSIEGTMDKAADIRAAIVAAAERRVANRRAAAG